MKSVHKLIIVCLTLLLCLCETVCASPAKASDTQSELSSNPNAAIALTYHRVRDGNLLERFMLWFSNSKELNTYSVTKREFEAQMAWLHAHDAHFLTEAELLKYKAQGHFPPRSVWISFDDMDETTLYNAQPILKKYDIPATGFLITGHVGDHDFHNLDLLTLAELKELHCSGRWNFSSHSHDLHGLKGKNANMTSVSKNVLTADIQASNAFLKKHFNEDNHSVAYPYGKLNERNIAVLEANGIHYGFTEVDKVIEPTCNNYKIPRILVSRDSFERLIKGWTGFHS